MPVSALMEARRERGATRLATGAGPAEQLVFPVEAHKERSCERNRPDLDGAAAHRGQHAQRLPVARQVQAWGRPVGVAAATLKEDRSGPPTAEATGAPAETAYLGGGWAVLDDWTPSEDELADRQERAWEAADEVNARWQGALRVVPHLSARRAKALWLRLLTVVSWLPAPDRDALRCYLTTDLRLDVLAALLRMPEHVFCELLLAATETVLGPASDEDDATSLTAILTRTARRLGRGMPMALPRGTQAPRLPAARRTLIPAKSAAIGGGRGHSHRGRPGCSPQDGPPRTAARALRVPAGPPAAALAPARGPRPQQEGDQPHRSRRRAHA